MLLLVGGCCGWFASAPYLQIADVVGERLPMERQGIPFDKRREIAGDEIQPARLFNCALVFLLFVALSVAADFHLNFDAASLDGGGHVRRPALSVGWYVVRVFLFP